MDLREFFQNTSVIRTGLNLARISPRWLGYGLAKAVGREIARSKPAVYWQIRENISIITASQDEAELDRITRSALVNAGKYYYDFYHTIGKPVEVMRTKVNIPDKFFEDIEQIQQTGVGVQLAGIHLSNFDLGAIVIASRGIKHLALSVANPSEGYQLQNQLRKKYGFVTTPITPKSLKQAVQRLKEGGVVANGLDWPHLEETNLTEVFGRPAYVPLGAARLALLTNCVTFIIALYNDSESNYHLYHSEPIEVIRTGNRQEDITANTRAYVNIFEKMVSRYPDQWMMFRQFWQGADGRPPE